MRSKATIAAYQTLQLTRLSIPYKHSSISYIRVGHGEKPVFCFHGFGGKSTSFAFLESYADGFTLIAPDLPFHGETVWKEGTEITPADMVSIVQLITDKESVTKGAKFSLLGYSFGARIALSLFQAAPELIDRLILLAPDGLKVNFWYRLAIHTKAGNRLFRYTLQSPGWFLNIARLLQRAGIKKNLAKFTIDCLQRDDYRQLLSLGWPGYKSFKPDIHQIKSLIGENKVPVRLFFGKADGIFHPRDGLKFSKGLESWCQISLLDCGHQLLSKKYAGDIVKALGVVG